jgi:hydroxypyruvate isomerase
MKLSACIENNYLFNEVGAVPARIRAAAAAGLDCVEFHLWDQVDMDLVEHTLKNTGMRVSCLVIAPRCGCVDASKEEYFLGAMRQTLQMVKRLGAQAVVVAGGPALAGASATQQRDAMVHLLKRAAPLAEAEGLQIWLEPLNSRIDHPGFFMNTAREGLEIVEAVGSPAVRLLYDVYHSTVMGEKWEDVLPHASLIGYVQVADTNGRREPGSGDIDWPGFLAALRATGYGGDIGMEFRSADDSFGAVARTRQVFGLA